MEKQKNIPVLRFPEFDLEWEREKMDYISTWASGGTPSKDNPLYWDGDIPWISASSMRGIEYSDSEIKITQEGLLNGSKLAMKGSLLILVRGSMLFNKIPIGITSKDVAFNQDVKSINIDSRHNTKFVLYWFFSIENQVLNMVTGTGIGAGKLDLMDLKNMSISHPTLPEQTKIANFLTAIDERLNQLKNKKTLLEQYKKGAMQKIFNQEIRFKDDDGSDYPDWEEKNLGEVCSINKGEQLNVSDLTESGMHPALNGGINPSGYTDKWNTESHIITISEGGNSCGYVNFNRKRFWCGGHCYALLNLKPCVNLNFLFQILKYNEVAIMRLRVGSGLPNIQKKDINNFNIQIPCLEEQTNIANFFSAIDEKINCCCMQIEKTEAYKKGLLQQMFV